MGIFNHSISKILMKKILIFILLSSCINSQETEKNNSYELLDKNILEQKQESKSLRKLIKKL